MAIIINGDKVKVGDVWELRNNVTVIISEILENLTWCIKAKDSLKTWDKNGLYSVNGEETPYDLVNLIRRAVVEDEIVEDKIVGDKIVEDEIVEDNNSRLYKLVENQIELAESIVKEQPILIERHKVLATIEQFKKFDTNKPRYSLIDPDWQEDVAKVLTMGAQKYDANNWKLCEDPERYIDALIRHLEDIRRGKFKDKESKLQHTAHISCNAMFLHWMIKNGVMK